MALLGLLYYLAYLFTGKDLLFPMAAGYLVYYLFLVYLVSAAEPASVEVERWTTTLAYENQGIIEGPLASLALLLLVAPQIIGALAYFTTFFRLEDPSRRYRVALVSWAIIIWFSSSLVGSFGGLSDLDWWQIVSRAISLAAAGAVLLAYRPPGFIQDRWGVEPASA